MKEGEITLLLGGFFFACSLMVELRNGIFEAEMMFLLLLSRFLEEKNTYTKNRKIKEKDLIKQKKKKGKKRYIKKNCFI